MILADAAVTSESSSWIGGFPISMVLAGFLGSMLMAMVIFYQRLVKASNPLIPSAETTASVVALMVVTIISGTIISYIGTPIVAEWRGVKSQAFVKGIAAMCGLMGIPITMALLAWGGKIVAMIAKSEPPKIPQPKE